MPLEIAVRFRNESYEEIGTGTIEIRSAYDDTPFLLKQLSVAAEPLLKSMINHAIEDAKTNLSKVEKPDES